MTQEELIKRLETTCFGLDPIDPLRLLVDDVIEALAQTERTWVGLTDEEVENYWDWEDFQCGCGRGTLLDMVRDIESKLKELNT
jgi:hypothetical protein